MGMGYTFICENCKYQEKEILLGRGRIDAKERVLGTCKKCKILFATKNQSCVKCKARNGLFRFAKPIKLYFKQEEYKNVECPCCNQISIKAQMEFMWD